MIIEIKLELVDAMNLLCAFYPKNPAMKSIGTMRTGEAVLEKISAQLDTIIDGLEAGAAERGEEGEKTKKCYEWFFHEERNTYYHFQLRCPYCVREVDMYYGPIREGDTVYCNHCGKMFELGKQK